jgi:hypothetical protein
MGKSLLDLSKYMASPSEIQISLFRLYTVIFAKLQNVILCVGEAAYCVLNPNGVDCCRRFVLLLLLVTAMRSRWKLRLLDILEFLVSDTSRYKRCCGMLLLRTVSASFLPQVVAWRTCGNNRFCAKLRSISTEFGTQSVQLATTIVTRKVSNVCRLIPFETRRCRMAGKWD